MLNALGDEERTFTVSLGKLQRHDGLHQPLLRSVVKVAHDPAGALVGSLHDASSLRAAAAMLAART